jgi:hypothetical protein
MRISWSEMARRTVADRNFLLIGIGSSQMADFARYGGKIAGAISVVPANSPATRLDDPYPIVTLAGSTRDIFEFVVDDFAQTIARNSAHIESFLQQIDLKRQATVVSHLPVPAEVFGDREIWAQDSRLSRVLETKIAGPCALTSSLPWVPFMVGKAPLTELECDKLIAKFLSNGLVIQRLGLNGGGTGTFVCRQSAQFRRCFDHLSPGTDIKIMPIVEGSSCNITGLVIDGKQVVVFPPSHQIMRIDSAGRPIYAGNKFGVAWPLAEMGKTIDEVRHFGRLLAEQGFRGPFGLDFIRTEAGDRYYHDLNPRINGAVDSLCMFLSEGVSQPLRVLLMSRRRWSQSEIDELESALHVGTAQIPSSRFLLSRDVQSELTIAKVPPSGLWREEAGNFVFLGMEVESCLGLASPDHFFLKVTAAPQTTVKAGERLMLGDLFCSQTFADRMTRKFGAELQAAILDMLMPDECFA